MNFRPGKAARRANHQDHQRMLAPNTVITWKHMPESVLVDLREPCWGLMFGCPLLLVLDQWMVRLRTRREIPTLL